MDLLFTPSREKFPEGAFLHENPINLVKTANAVPTIAGVAEKDGVVALFGNNYNYIVFKYLGFHSFKAVT